VKFEYASFNPLTVARVAILGAAVAPYPQGEWRDHSLDDR
jgi:hypothetical protein